MKHIFTKFKKRIVSFLMIPAVSLTIGANTYYTAMASAEEALAAEAFELVPLTWDVFTEIMVALGVGTASYWAAKDVNFRGSTLEEISRELVPEVDWFYQDMADFGQRDIPEYIEGVGGWIKSVVADGKTFLSEDVLSVFTSFASEQGWLGGVTDGSITAIDSPVFSVGTIDSVNFVDANTLGGYIQANWGKIGYYDYAYGNSISSFAFPAGAILITPVQDISVAATRPGYIDFVLLSDLVGASVASISSISNLSFNSGSITSGYQYSLSSSIPGHRLRFNNNSISNISVKTLYSSATWSYSYAQKSFRGLMNAISGISTVGNDVPIGEKGQVVDNDGAIDYPWPVPYPVDVNGVLSLPWTVPQDVAGDVIVTSPDTTIPIPLDNPAVKEGYVDRDLPTDTTQEEAQDGTHDVPESVPSESPVSPSANTFMLPNWITQRFPFCIPFDLKRGADLFASAGDEPPKWTFTLHYGLHGEHSYDVVIDMSRFNGLMSVFRIGEFVLFLVGLAFVTRSILRS